MLIPKPNIRILTRKVMLTNGAEALAYFVVLDVLGVLEFKFLGTRILETSTKCDVLLLENHRTQIFGEIPVKSVYEIFSPFYTLDFLTSQLARAPSVK